MFHVKHLLFALVFLPLMVSAQMGTTSLEAKPLPPMPSLDKSVDDFMISNSVGFELSREQSDWFYWTNYSRANPRRFWDSVVAPIIRLHPQMNNSFSISLKKDLYASKPLPLLKPSRALNKAAASLATALAKKKSQPSHTAPNGETFADRMNKAGIQTCAGENISYGPWAPVMMLVLLYIDEGVPDTGHRKSLLDPSFTEMGIGIGEFPDGTMMVVQEFACPQSK